MKQKKLLHHPQSALSKGKVAEGDGKKCPLYEE